MGELLSVVKDIFSNNISSQNKVNKYNYIALSFAAGSGHIFFGFYWTYLDPQIYESFILRALGVLTCIILLSTLQWQDRFHKFILPVWIVTLIYNLPFFFTVSLIRNNFSEIWLAGEATMIFVVILFLTEIIKSLLAIISGIAAAILFCVVTKPESVFFDHKLIEIAPIYLLTIISSYIFSFSNSKSMSVAQDILYEEKSKAIKSLAGSIAHELRNPLNSINLIKSQINDLLANVGNDFDKSSEELALNGAIKNNKKLLALTSNIADSISSANSIIDIILSDLRDKPINPRDFAYINTKNDLVILIEKYAFKSELEKSKVFLNLKVSSKNYFVFKAVPERFAFIIYNLLKNSLYYIKEYPDITINIGIETKTIDTKIFNIVYLKDTGPGISPENINKLFEDFFTSGKKEGTGLGLAFCKRNMKAFGGDIICESEFGKWTKFSLLFPQLSEEEIKMAETESRKKKILIVDDQRSNLLAVKSRVEKGLPYVACDIVVGGKDGAEMALANNYNAILMDIQMPDVNGVEATRRIRASNKEIPIIATTSLDYDSFAKEAESLGQDGFNYYLSKSIPESVLFRNITKWMADMEDKLPYLGAKESYAKLLLDKSAILADDQDLNRMVTKNKLKSSGMKITEVKDGKELVEAYKNSLDKDGKSSFDIILTDINMPPYNGDEASQEVRSIEVQNKIPHQNKIPIIALSGDGDQEAVNRFFKCQMTDYFVKGRDPESLIKIIANCFVEVSEEIEDMSFEIHDEAHPAPEKNEVTAEITTTPESLKTLDSSKINSFEEADRKEILETFVRESDAIIEKIKGPKGEEDIKELSFLVHSMKGISNNIGAEKLYEYVREIEPNLKGGKFPEDANWVTNIQNFHAELKLEIKKVLG